MARRSAQPLLRTRSGEGLEERDQRPDLPLAQTERCEDRLLVVIELHGSLEGRVEADHRLEVRQLSGATAITQDRSTRGVRDR